ncbi:SphA family protein [Pseudomonas fluorescens]|uniref:SphA family protein n=1 Tax=Pseudomonas fluorescens TaxID=294 RepID=UPI003F9696E9
MMRASTLLNFNCQYGYYAVAVLLLSTPVQATESNSTAYPLGLDTVLSGRMAPPGLNTFFYSSAYKATRANDASGHEQKNLDDFNLSYEAIALCLNYVYSDYTLFGATVASRAAQTYISGQVNWYDNTPQGRVRYSGKDEGLGNLAFTPLFLGWSSPRLYQIIGLDFYAPTASYDKDKLFNVGNNVWSYSPWYSFTAYPSDKFEASAKFIYMINEKNRDTAYQSGREINIDYHFAYSMNQNWQIGASGYVYKQVSDDKSYGEAVSHNGNRGQSVGFGPSVKFQNQNMVLVLKWQHEALVENRAQGERVWFQAVLPF